MRWVVPLAGGSALLVGAVHIVLWALGVPPRWSADGMITLKTNTAFGLTLAAAALLLLQCGSVTSARRSAARAMAGLVSLLGGLTLAEHLLAVDLGIDQLIFQEQPGQPGVLSPNRMGPPAALSFTLLGAGLFALASNFKAARGFGIATCCVVSVPAIGILFGADPLHQNPYLTSIAWPAASALLALGLGLSAAETGRHQVPLFWREDPGGALMRRMLGPAVALPVAIGYLRLAGERHGLFDPSVGTSLLVVALAMLFSGLLWWSARGLSAVAAERRESEERYRSLFTRMTEGFALGEPILDEQGTPVDFRFEEMNEAFEQQTGLSRADVVGRPLRTVLPNLEQQWIDTYGRVALTGTSTRFEDYNRDLDRHFSVFAFSPAPGRFEVLFTDVTERRRSEAALRTAEEQRRLALRAADLGTWSFEVRTGALSWDERFQAIYGVAALGMPYPEFLGSLVHPDDRTRLEGALLRARDPVSPQFERVFEVEYRVTRPDGAVRWVEVKGEALFEDRRADDPRPVRFVGTAADVTDRKGADEALKDALAQAEERGRLLEATLDHVPLGITIADAPDVMIRYVSRYGRELVERREDELTGIPAAVHPAAWQILNADGQTPAAAEELPLTRATMKGELVKGEEWVVVRKDGVPVPILCTAAPIRDPHGRITGGVIGWQDITDRKRAEAAVRESESKYRALFEHMAMGFTLCRVIFDGERPVDYVHEEVNAAFCAQSGLRREDVVGRRITEIIPAARDDAGRLIEMLGHVALTGAAVHYEHHVPSLGRWFEATAYCPKPGYFANLFLDVTERKNASAALSAATERLLEADRRKNEFLAMLSHELRNPLAPVANSLYILERAAPGGDQARRAHDVIGRQVWHMTRLIDDLLDVTRISRGKIRLHKTRVELCELVHRTAEDHRSLFAANQVELVLRTCSTPLHVRGDATRLAQVIGNLLSNAVKFTQPGGRVVLSLAAAGQGTATLSVRDTGAGIAPELLSRLFEPFVQADATLDRSKGGLGLGLALVRGVARPAT